MIFNRISSTPRHLQNRLHGYFRCFVSVSDDSASGVSLMVLKVINRHLRIVVAEKRFRSSSNAQNYFKNVHILPSALGGVHYSKNQRSCDSEIIKNMFMKFTESCQ